MRQEWDDTARMYREFDVQSGDQTFSRAYTAAENAAADAAIAAKAASTNGSTIRQLLTDTLPILETITNTTNANMTGNTAAAAIKDEARALRRIIRILTNTLDGTS